LRKCPRWTAPCLCSRVFLQPFSICISSGRAAISRSMCAVSLI
jgi:hypothetical protein